MNTNKLLVGGIIGGIANFILGFLVWGLALMGFFKDHTTDIGKTVMRKDANGEDSMIWWSLIAANLLSGLLLSYILNKAGAMSASAGAGIGAVVGLLLSATINLFNYSFMDMSDMTAMVVDIAAGTVVTAIVGGIIGWYLGMGKKTA